MRTSAPSRGALAAVIAFALSCFGLLFYLWVTFGGPVPLAAHGYRFSALYTDTNGASDVQWIACIEAITPSLPKRGMSAGSRCCACSIRHRRSRLSGCSRNTLS